MQVSPIIINVACLLLQHSVILGQLASWQTVTKLSLATILSGGHLLIEDLPGTGKTTFAKSITDALNLDFKRIQFTSDLLPSDILGYTYLKKDKFELLDKSIYEIYEYFTYDFKHHKNHLELIYTKPKITQMKKFYSQPLQLLALQVLACGLSYLI